MIGFHTNAYTGVDIFDLCRLPAAQFDMVFVTTNTTGVIIGGVGVPLEGRMDIFLRLTLDGEADWP